MPQIVKKGQSFLIPSGTSKNPGIKHLHVILSEPQNECVILVSITSWTGNLCDGSCILNKGDHPFIQHKSWALYRSARIVSCSELEYGARQGIFIPKEDVSAILLTKLCRGLLSSSYTKRAVKKYAAALKNWP